MTQVNDRLSAQVCLSRIQALVQEIAMSSVHFQGRVESIDSVLSEKVQKLQSLQIELERKATEKHQHSVDLAQKTRLLEAMVETQKGDIGVLQDELNRERQNAGELKAKCELMETKLEEDERQLCRENESLKKSVDETSKRLEDTLSEKEELMQLLGEEEGKRESQEKSFQQVVGKLEGDLQQSQESFDQLKVEYEARFTSQNEEMASKEAEIGRLRDEIQDMAKAVEHRKQVEVSMNGLELDLQSSRHQVGDLQKQLEVEKEEKAVLADKFSQERKDMEEKINELEQRKDDLAKNLEEKSEELFRMVKTHAEGSSSITKLEQQIEEWERKASEANKELRDMLGIREELETQLTTVRIGERETLFKMKRANPQPLTQNWG